jgi:ABC-type lipoprotein release transport system permease subunit
MLQSALIVAAGLAVGLPLGLALGRWSWSTWAGGIGVVDTAVTPTRFLAAVVPVSIAAAVLAAVRPAHRAARLQIAEILRAE